MRSSTFKAHIFLMGYRLYQIDCWR